MNTKKRPNLKEVFLWCKRNVTPNQAAKIVSLMRRLGSYHVEGLDKERDALHDATIEVWNGLSEMDGSESLKTTISTNLMPLRMVLSKALGVDVSKISFHISEEMSQRDYRILLEKCGYESCMDFVNDSYLDFANEFAMTDEENWSFDELECSVNRCVALTPGDAISKQTNAKDLCEKFGLKDIRCVAESDDVWQNTLDHLNDALTNLANAIGLKESEFKLIGFYGKLRLNIGPYFSKYSACCQFGTQEDKEGVIIVLDGIAGWGSLAHEWWHACDFTLASDARKTSGVPNDRTLFTELMASSDKVNKATALRQAMLDVITAINEDSGENKEQLWVKWNDEMESLKSNYFEKTILPRAGEKRNHVEVLMNDWFESLHDGVKLEEAMNGFQKIVDVCPSEGRCVPYIRAELECAISKAANIKKKPKDSLFKHFARRISKLTHDGGYADSIAEMSARSFESSVINQHLSDNNIVVRSLIDMKDGIGLYPQGAERVNQNRAWKSTLPHIIDALKRPVESTPKTP
jgi:hypothetical protein